MATSVGSLAVDVGDKVSRELRSFGANIRVAPAGDVLSVEIGGANLSPAGSGAFLSQNELVRLKKIFWRNNIIAFAPLLPVPARAQGASTTLVGTWFDKNLAVDNRENFRTGLREMHPAWRIEGAWPDEKDSSGSLVGRRLALRQGLSPGMSFSISGFASPAPTGGARAVTLTLVARGVLDSGGPEDDELFAPLETVQRAFGLEGKVRRVDVSALTKPEDSFAHSDVTRLAPAEFDRWYCTPYVSSIAYQIQEALPGSDARPIYRVAETEGRILDRVGILMAVLTAAALAAATLAVASMMLATVLERRVEIGLFKSLGASDGRVAAIFLGEAFSLSLAGGVAGFIGGVGLARWVGVTVFGSAVTFHWLLFPAALALALAVTLVGSALPLVHGLRTSPVEVLRG